jgi:hypothetical protein
LGVSRKFNEQPALFSGCNCYLASLWTF